MTVPGDGWLVVFAAGCALALAACGSSAKKQAASVGPALRFSDCMRSNGVPNFPDPGSGGNLELNGTGINRESPSFRAAQKACARFQPGGPGLPKTSESLKQRALKFAQCVRTHGEPNFPDPSLTAPRGAASILLLRGMVFAFPQPFDAQSPAFRQAAAACGLKVP